jgi:hypothetical protein
MIRNVSTVDWAAGWWFGPVCWSIDLSVRIADDRMFHTGSKKARLVAREYCAGSFFGNLGWMNG